MKLYKVFKRENDVLVSPFQGYNYSPGVEYVCERFDPNGEHACSKGFYATGVDGIIYSFRNLPGYEVWECEVGGRTVEIDQFKRRYERIKLIRHVPNSEVKEMALQTESKVGYKLAEALFPLNPLKIRRRIAVTGKEVELLRQWASVRDSIRASVRDSVTDSPWASVWPPVWTSVRDAVWDVWDSVCDLGRDAAWNSAQGFAFRFSAWVPAWDYARDSIRDSVWSSCDSTGDTTLAYVSSLFPGITKWKYIDHPEGENPFQPAVDLWRAGLVPSFDGQVWRLHAGEKAEVVWMGKDTGEGRLRER